MEQFLVILELNVCVPYSVDYTAYLIGIFETELEAKTFMNHYTDEKHTTHWDKLAGRVSGRADLIEKNFDTAFDEDTVRLYHLKIVRYSPGLAVPLGAASYYE